MDLTVSVRDAEELAQLLEDTLSWRQLRRLAKRNHIRQYSYLGKRGLALYLAYQAENRAKRNLTNQRHALYIEWSSRLRPTVL
jgi:hypothetical protein